VGLTRPVRRLVKLRHAAITLLAVEAFLVLGERLALSDPLPERIDVVVAIAGAATICLLVVVEVWLSAARRRLGVDADRFAAVLERAEDEDRVRQVCRMRIERVLEADGEPTIVFQPIVDLRNMRPAGVEALARFTGETADEHGAMDTPDVWFAAAARVGLAVPLEIKAIRVALTALPLLPQTLYLSLNCSPPTLMSDELYEMLMSCDARRVVVELTEHLPISDYPACRAAIDRLRSLGVRLAIDDLGTGYASLSHVIQLRPEIVKLDRSLADALNPSTELMVHTLVSLGRLIGAVIVAEGLQDAASLELARTVGVDLGQGFHLSSPAPLTEILTLNHLPHVPPVPPIPTARRVR
jgi:EAL domain-containing protein (putative c-di-GMP-specific phosphodiesterase class I)